MFANVCSRLLKPFYGTNYFASILDPGESPLPPLPPLERLLSLAAASRSRKGLRLRFLTHELNSLSKRSDGQCFELSDEKMLLWKGFLPTHLEMEAPSALL